MSGATGTGLQGWRAAALLLALPLSNVAAALMVGPVEPGHPIASPTAFAAPIGTGEKRARTLEEKPFSHKDHVQRWWFEFDPKSGASRDGEEAHVFKEVPKDCRGCHDFGAKDADGTVTRPPNSPVQTCYSCHFEGRLERHEFKSGVERLEKSRLGQHGFDHLDHDDLACRECHGPTQGSASDGSDFADLSGERGLATCVRCHGEGWEEVYEEGYDELHEKNVDRNKLRAGFSSALDALLAPTAEGSGPFLHTDHMTAAELVGSASCTECHNETASRDVAALAAHVFSISSCAECHGTEDFPVTIRRDLNDRASLAALTFSHADHLKETDPGDEYEMLAKGHAEIHDQDCLACHVHPEGTINGDMVETFLLMEKREGFDGCMTCHGDSPRYSAPGHQKIDFWKDKCADCHSFGTKDLAQDRRVAAVDRLSVGEVRFLVPPQKHPGLGVPKDNDCRECHKGPMPESPSRLLDARFEHAAHLTPEPTAEECLACHAKVGKADTSAAIGLAWSDEEPSGKALLERLSFSVESCDKCHHGIQVDINTIGARELRKVKEFDHAAHLAVPAEDSPDGAKMDCSSCHEPVSGLDGRRKDIGVLPSAADCTQCHGHDDERAPFSRSIDMTQVGSCGTCHVEQYPGIDGKPLVIPQAHASLAGAQMHPVGRDRCADCHVLHPIEPIEPIVAVTATFTNRDNPHSAAGWPQVSCYVCHWVFDPQNGNEPVKTEERAQALASNLEMYRGPR